MNGRDNHIGGAGDRRRGRRRWVATTVAMIATVAWTTAGDTPVEAATSLVGLWEMNEGAGATTMVDSGPFGFDGVVGPAIQTGAVHAGALGYRWSNVSPTAPPAKPERIAYVPSSRHLNPDSGDYAIEFRYRTTRSFGNVVQKGQNATPGGYFKFEQPNGNMTCLFKGGNGQQRAIRSPIRTNDGNWHTIRCERTATFIRLFVNGVQVGRLNGPTGNISNTQRLSIGGKSTCDQIEITCDYFVGDIDYIRIEKAGAVPPPNQPPVAAFTPSCDELACTFDSAASTDSDGTIVQRQWTLGDGTTATGPTTAHTYAAPGPYVVTLTVTDDDGASTQTQRTLNLGQPAGAISFVGGAASSATSTTHRTTLPSVEAGDAVLLFLTVGSAVTVGQPTGVTGWELVGTAAAGSGSTTVWKKVAAAGDAGRTVTITTSASAKSSLGVVAYRGASDTDPVAAFARTIHTSGAGRTSPAAPVDAPGSLVVSYWAHRDSSSTSLVPPAGVVTRLTGTQSGGGRITMLLADSGGPVGIGSYGGLTATAQASSSFATSWTLVLRPG